MNIFESLPDDLIVELLLYCNNDSICALTSFLTSCRYNKIYKTLLEKMRGSLKQYKNVDDFNVGKPNIKCDLCDCDVLMFPHIEIFSGCHPRAFNINKYDILEKLRRHINREKDTSTNTNTSSSPYTFNLNPDEYQPSGGFYRTYNVCWFCATQALNPNFTVVNRVVPNVKSTHNISYI